MEFVTIANRIISILFLLCCTYQFFYVFVALVERRRREAPTSKLGRYAVLISARNEEPVIGGLITSLQNQNYPQDRLDIYVVADNCTDDTASVARLCGATCWERFDTSRVGKGYALSFLLDMIKARGSFDQYDGFFVFDADNLLEENFVSEMNKVFQAGNRVVTSYRNSKNYGDNWISSGYSLWFLRDCRFLSSARMALRTSTAVTGTGFLMHRDLLENGWDYHLLTEDTEFTMDLLLHGERVAYCDSAILYDEQPTTFSQSWRQRMRWARGYIQVFGKYGGALVKRLVCKRDFAVFDMLMTYLPAIVLTIASAIVNIAALVAMLVAGSLNLVPLILTGIAGMCFAYLSLFAIGVLTIITEWRRIHCSTEKKLRSLFTFPLFMLTYIPVSIAAVFCPRVEWKPIQHSVRKSLQQVRSR